MSMLRFYRILYVVIPLLIGASAWVHVMLPAESDKGWLLHAAHRWLEGGRLYVDIFEVNPPLIVMLYALPVWVSTHVAGLADSEALAGLGLAICALSAWAGTCVIRLHPAFAGNTAKQIKFALLLGLIFVFYTKQSYFFDREHILLVLIFPYVLRFMPSLAERTPSLRLRIIIGCMAAVGFCVKPHTIIIFAALQLFTLLRTRSFAALLSLENRIIAALGVLYVLSIWIFTPEYFQTVLPMALETYSSFGSINSGPSTYLPPFFVGMGVIFAHFRAQATPYRKDVYYLVGVSVAFLVYALANNGWDYTYNPLYCLLMFISAWLLWEYDWLRGEYETRGMPTQNILFGLRGCVIVLTVNAAYIVIYLLAMASNMKNIRTPCDENPQCPYTPQAKYMVEHQYHSFGTMTLDFSNWITLMRLTGAHWETRFNHLWMMSKLMQSGAGFRADHRWIAEIVAKGFAEDLDRHKPDMLFVDNSPGFIGWPHSFDLPGYFSEVPAFKEAWSHYRFADSLNFCGNYGNSAPISCRYDVYSRIAP